MSLLEAALDQGAGNPELIAFYAKALEEVADYDRAATRYREAAELARELGDQQAALTYFDHALGLQPGDTRARRRSSS